MLTERDSAAWVGRAGLPQPAQAAIAHIRSSGPARSVGGGRSNVTGRYPSKKMGVTIQFESHRVELPAIFELEHASSVLEYYDQAPAIKLEYRSADGKRLGVMHTPDFFVIREDRAGWEECKTEEELMRLSERNPNRYRRDGQEWICPPGRQHAEPLGLYYRVRSSAEINWLFQRNVQFLEDYLRTPVSVPPLQRQRVLAHVIASLAISVRTACTPSSRSPTKCQDPIRRQHDFFKRCRSSRRTRSSSPIFTEVQATQASDPLRTSARTQSIPATETGSTSHLRSGPWLMLAHKRTLVKSSVPATCPPKAL